MPYSQLQSNEINFFHYSKLSKFSPSKNVTNANYISPRSDSNLPPNSFLINSLNIIVLSRLISVKAEPYKP